MYNKVLYWNIVTESYKKSITFVGIFYNINYYDIILLY